MTNSNVALITGASGGIGLELARIHAKKGGDVILVARSQDKLEKLKEELEGKYAISATVIPEDLSQADSAQRIFDKTEEKGLVVNTLINNAGFGGHGLFHTRSLADEQAMMQVNIVTLTNLTHLYLKGMVERKQGKVLNVSSVGGFIPGPLEAVYFATKAFVTSFSQAISEEVSEYGVTVTVHCPGPVTTGFAERSGMEGLDMWKTAKSVESAAASAYTAMDQGELVAFNEAKLGFMANWILPLMPRKILLKNLRRSMERKS